jgi:membrane-associated phospholipid phosphatase
MRKTLKCYPMIVFALQFISTKAPAQSVDLRILEAINPRYPTSSYWKYTSASAYLFSGIATTAPFVYGIASGNKQIQYESYQVLIAMGLDLAAMQTLKVSVNRERPGDRYPDQVFPSSATHGKSFPSGHTSIAFNTAAELTIQYKKWYVAVPAYLWAGSVGYSRIYLGKHYPSDVLGGAATGIGSAYLSTWLNHKLFKTHYYHE